MRAVYTQHHARTVLSAGWKGGKFLAQTAAALLARRQGKSAASSQQSLPEFRIEKGKRRRPKDASVCVCWPKHGGGGSLFLSRKGAVEDMSRVANGGGRGRPSAAVNVKGVLEGQKVSGRQEGIWILPRRTRET